MKQLIFILALFPTVLLGQVATFSADTFGFNEYKNSRPDIYNRILEAEWKINGNTLHYGSIPIVVETDGRIDTIFYKQHSNAKWDTLMCNITQPAKYSFHYNECCGGFQVFDEANQRIMGSVIFFINGSNNQKQYLGTLGEVGVLVHSTLNDILKPGCRSALSPNIYPVALRVVEICADTVDCKESTCLYEKGALKYEFGYKTISTVLDCWYLPLSSQPLKIMYDPRTGTVKME